MSLTPKGAVNNNRFTIGLRGKALTRAITDGVAF